MRNMTIPQVQAMVGTTFTYFFPDGDSIGAVIAAFVPKKGFTCLATETVTNNGEDLSDHMDKNGEICLIGIHAEYHDLMPDVSFRCRAIRDTGEYRKQSDTDGTTSCALS